jgi:hypothetical protein
VHGLLTNERTPLSGWPRAALRTMESVGAPY